MNWLEVAQEQVDELGFMEARYFAEEIRLNLGRQAEKNYLAALDLIDVVVE